MRNRPEGREGFVHSVSLAEDRVPSWDFYPFRLAAIRALGRLQLHPAVTFFVGENGSGKSTLIEGIAVKMNFDELGGDAETGFRNRFDHRELDGGLHDALNVTSSRRRRPSDHFFMRAETVYNFSSKLDEDVLRDPSARWKYGGESLHERSHGEAFLTIIQNRLRPESLILMDEPEAALSPSRQLTFLLELDMLVRSGCQLIIATHSPILMAYPDALIYQIDPEGFHPTPYQETEHYKFTKAFLSRPDAYLRRL